MDTTYDLTAGILTMGMGTYIESTMERFLNFDLSLGIPYREIVGCLLWIVLCVVGPELVRVKDLARRSNAPTCADYDDALKALKRIFKRRGVSVILFKRGFASRELRPFQLRPESSVVALFSHAILPVHDKDPEVRPPLPAATDDDFELSPHTQADLFQYFDNLQSRFDIQVPPLPTSSRFTTVAYTDASFAVGDEKFSISGFVIYVNGTPVMWGSMRQTSVADSTCAAEFVAASVCCKQLLHLENIFHFLGFVCPKPYIVYTDSQASQTISMNNQRMGKIRYIAIRYHLVRVLASHGDVLLVFCVTEDMVADLLTKILSGATFNRLATRFYFMGV
jgi:hypothetical protein